MPFCTACRTQAPDTAASCSKCGAELPTTIAPYMQPSPWATPSPHPSSTPPSTSTVPPPMTQSAYQPTVRQFSGQAGPWFIAAAATLLLCFVGFFCPTMQLTKLGLVMKQFSFIELATDNIPDILMIAIFLGPIGLAVAVARMVPPFFRRLYIYPRNLTAAIIASLYSLIVVGIFPMTYSSTVRERSMLLYELELTIGGWLHIVVAITAVVTVVVVAVKVRLSEAHARKVVYG